jgi:hypothetical protein
MSLTAALLQKGFQAVDLKAGNVKVGDSIVNRNDFFGELIEITKKGYVVRYDADWAGEPPSVYTAEVFERFFLVDKRK